MKGNLACSDGCGKGFENKFTHKLIQIELDVIACGFKELHINSGPRCTRHNAEIGGAKNSAHMRGVAADIHFGTGGELYTLIKICLKNDIERIGINFGSSFIHIDDGRIMQGYMAPLMWLYK
jgi:uncharacterized protein YcbK (DUF882 family)